MSTILRLGDPTTLRHLFEGDAWRAIQTRTSRTKKRRGPERWKEKRKIGSYPFTISTIRNDFAVCQDIAFAHLSHLSRRRNRLRYPPIKRVCSHEIYHPPFSSLSNITSNFVSTFLAPLTDTARTEGSVSIVGFIIVTTIYGLRFT